MNFVSKQISHNIKTKFHLRIIHNILTTKASHVRVKRCDCGDENSQCFTNHVFFSFEERERILISFRCPCTARKFRCVKTADWPPLQVFSGPLDHVVAHLVFVFVCYVIQNILPNAHSLIFDYC